MKLAKKTRKKPGLSVQIMIGMGLGLLAGIFFGEYCAFLQIIGDAFIKLLQMTILPYITVSLILGIGGMTFDQAKLLAKKAGLLMLLFWAICLAMVLLLPLSFPHWQSAAFFSTSSVQPPKSVNFLNLYIPSNPFYSLANNIVPAVVLFSIMVGIALIGMQKKRHAAASPGHRLPGADPDDQYHCQTDAHRGVRHHGRGGRHHDHR